MAKFPKIGLAAIFETKEFKKGTQEYLSGIAKASGATDKAAAAMTAAGGIIATVVGVGLAAALAGILAVTAGVIGLSVAFTKLAIAAAPLEGIGIAFTNMAGRAGLSLEALRKAAAGTISDFELMRTANIALTGAGDNLAIAFGEKLPKLLAIARASAKATGQSVDFLFTSLVTGVKRSSPMLIDNTGLMLKLGEANAALANELGTTVKALSAEQKQIAILNATVLAGQKILDQFGDAQLTTAEQLARVRAGMKNLTDFAGLAFTPALNTLTGAFADLLDMMNRSITEGGVLQDVLVAIGSVASLVADGLAAMVDVATREGEGFFTTLIDWLSRTATSAFRWGIDIAVMLADGLIRGAAAAITFAMQMITNLLTGWLSPGSPPKVAPDIIDWGMETMTMWLKGFGKADFGILRGIQKPLKSAFDVLQKLGEISGKKAAEAFISISQAIASGVTGEDLFAQIAESAGQFGTEIADLARLEFGLADAIDAVAEAEEAVAEARKAELDASKQVSDATRQFNQLLREGATSDVLDAKMAEIAAAEDARDLAKGQRSDAEAQVDAAQERQDLLREQLDLQKQLVDQLILLAQMSIIPVDKIAEEIDEAVEGGGAGGEDIGVAIGEGIGAGIGGTFPDIGQLLADKIAEGKQKILDAIAELIAPVRKKWDEEWAPIFEELGKKFEAFTKVVRQFYEKNIEPKFILLGEWLEDKLPKAWEAHQKAQEKVWEWMGENILPIFLELKRILDEEVGEILLTLTDIWNENFLPAIIDAYDFIIDFLTPAFEAVEKGLKIIGDYINDTLMGILDDFISNRLDVLESGLDAINKALKAFKGWLDKLAQRIKTMPKLPDYTKESVPPLAAGLMDINKEMRKLATIEIPKLVAGISLVNTASMVPAGRSPIATTVNRTATVNFGGVTVTDGMSLASLETTVRRIIRTEFG